MEVLLIMSLLQEYGIEEDERFVQANKEAFRVLLFVIAETIIVFGLAIWGNSMAPGEYTYILGMPMWFFWLFLLACILFPLAAIYLGTKIKDCDLTDKLVAEDLDHR
jgi:uncharacterized membrane protein YhdT